MASINDRVEWLACTPAWDYYQRPVKDGTDARERKRRLTTAFGWIAGGSLGLLLNYAFFVAIGEGYPTIPTTFTLFLLGAFGGMALADVLGDRGFRPLGITAGLLLSLFLVLVITSFLGAAP